MHWSLLLSQWTPTKQYLWMSASVTFTRVSVPKWSLYSCIIITSRSDYNYFRPRTFYSDSPGGASLFDVFVIFSATLRIRQSSYTSITRSHQINIPVWYHNDSIEIEIGLGKKSKMEGIKVSGRDNFTKGP